MVSKSRTVLCVDADPSTRRALWSELRLAGFGVLLACSGREAINLLRKNDVAAVVWGERMPGMIGVEMVELALHLLPRTARIALTQRQADPDGSECEADGTGVFRYLPKTWKPGELLQAVRDATDPEGSWDLQMRT